MNDRFKFRIWHKPLKQMHYNDFIVTATGYMAKIYQQDDYMMKFNQEDLEFDKQCILMQCTGLKDKNGKLIYEEDIVRLKAKNGMTFDYAVKFKNYCFILEYINGKLKGTKARNFAKQYAQPQRMYEHGYIVIGNIYENKELLEEECQK